MRRIWINRVLLSRFQMNFTPYRIEIFRPRRRQTSRSQRPLPWYIKRNTSPPAAKSFFLPRYAANRRMPMLRTSLPRNHHQLLRAHPLRIHIGEYLQTRRRQLAQTKIRHFHPSLLFRGNQYPRPPQQFRSSHRNLNVLQSALTSMLIQHRRRASDTTSPAG